MSLEVNDVLSWEKFLKGAKSRSSYPPKKIDLFNRLIAHTKNFFLVSPYGAFTPGYVMMVSKKLIPSMGMIEERNMDEFKWLISKVIYLINKTYDRDTVYFEHGMCACVGGLDRAHLHFMSIKKNLKANIIKNKINKVLVLRRAGIKSVEINGHQLTNSHDIEHIMETSDPKDYKIKGSQYSYEDINNNLDIDSWPISTRSHSLKGGHYVFFKTNNSESSFLTNKNFQTQLGRQIVFEIEKETNEEMREIFNKEIKKNRFANIWKWQEFSFEQNMINTMNDMRIHLADLKKKEPKYEFETF